MKVYLETFEIARMLDDVVATVQPLVGKNGNRLEVDCAPDCGSDALGSHQGAPDALQLLSNASKFTEKGRDRLRAWPRDAGAPAGDWIIVPGRATPASA